MPDTKIVFVQTEEENIEKIAEFFGSLKQVDYHFVVLPINTKLLTKSDVIELLRGLTGE